MAGKDVWAKRLPQRHWLVGTVADVVCVIVIPSTIVFQRSGLDITQIVLAGGVFGLFTLTGVLNIADGVWGNRGGAYVGEIPAA